MYSYIKEIQEIKYILRTKLFNFQISVVTLGLTFETIVFIIHCDFKLSHIIQHG